MSLSIEFPFFHSFIKPNATLHKFISILLNDKESIKYYFTHPNLTVCYQCAIFPIYQRNLKETLIVIIIQ